MIIRIITFVVFLLSTYSVCSSTSVDVYGDYDFNKRELSVFWKNNIVYDSYKVDLYALPTVYSDTCINVNSGVLATTRVTTTSNIIFTNVGTLLEPVKCRVIIYGIKNNVETLIYKQEFYIYLLSTSYRVEWELCNLSGGYEYLGVYEHSTLNPNYVFDTNRFIESWESSVFIDNDIYGKKKYVIFTSVGKEPGSDTIIVSQPSGIFILYHVLPEKPKLEGITN